jgi:hypothetical protein
VPTTDRLQGAPQHQIYANEISVFGTVSKTARNNLVKISGDEVRHEINTVPRQNSRDFFIVTLRRDEY